jgi:hypothetical protein
MNDKMELKDRIVYLNDYFPKLENEILVETDLAQKEKLKILYVLS